MIPLIEIVTPQGSVWVAADHIVAIFRDTHGGNPSVHIVTTTGGHFHQHYTTPAQADAGLQEFVAEWGSSSHG